MKKKLMAFVATLLLTLPGSAEQAYSVDADHSRIGFSVTHLQLSEVEGRFKDFRGSIEWNKGKAAPSEVSFTVQAESIDTANGKRDGHLKGADFFHVEKFPTLSFQSTSVKKVAEGRFALEGDLTVRGVTKRISIPARIRGPVDSFQNGNLSVGFSSDFKINRIDYGVGAGWKDGSDKLVGHDVFISIRGEAHQQ